MVPFWYSVGQGCYFLKLPCITGYIVGGILCGPHVSAILQKQHLTDVDFIEHICLSYIALLAGAELHLGGIKRIRRQVTWMVAGISFFSWAFVFSCALLASQKTPFLATLPRNQRISVCNLLGVLALARSPASAISVIHEIKGSGPYTSLVLAIVIVKDVLVFLVFSLALNAADQAFSGTKSGGNYLANILYPLFSIASSLFLGTLGGIVFQKFQYRLASTNSSTTTHSQLHTFVRGTIPLIVSSSVYFISDRMQAEPLLACVAAGAAATFIATSSSSSSSSSSHTHQADHQIKLHASPSPIPRLQRQGSVLASLGSAGTATSEETSTHSTSHHQQQQHLTTMFLVPVSAILFGLVGANIHIDKLLGNVHIAAMLFAVRLAGIWIGSWVGGVLGAVPATLRRRLFYGMITQAGIAMGLTRIAVARCKTCTWGPDFEAVMAAVIVGNLILGPLLFKSAIVAAGEAAAVTVSVGIPNSLAATTTAGGGGAVPLSHMKNPAYMEEGFVTPIKPEKSHQYDGHIHNSNNNNNNNGISTNTAPSTYFVPIIHINSSSTAAKMAL